MSHVMSPDVRVWIKISLHKNSASRDYFKKVLLGSFNVNSPIKNFTNRLKS